MKVGAGDKSTRSGKWLIVLAEDSCEPCTTFKNGYFVQSGPQEFGNLEELSPK